MYIKIDSPGWFLEKYFDGDLVYKDGEYVLKLIFSFTSCQNIPEVATS